MVRRITERKSYCGRVMGYGKDESMRRYENIHENVWRRVGVLVLAGALGFVSPLYGLTGIPHTQEETTLTAKRIGAVVNLENDMIAKYVEKLKITQ